MAEEIISTRNIRWHSLVFCQDIHEFTSRRKPQTKQKTKQLAKKWRKEERKKEKYIIKTVGPSGKGSPEQKSYNLNESHSQCQVTLESDAFTVILRKKAQWKVHSAGVRCIEKTSLLWIGVCVVLFLSTNALKLQRVKRSRLNIRRLIICFVSGAYL